MTYFHSKNQKHGSAQPAQHQSSGSATPSQRRQSYNYAPSPPDHQYLYTYMPPPQAQAPTAANTMLFQNQAQHVHALPQHGNYTMPVNMPHDAPSALFQYHGAPLGAQPTFPTPVASHFQSLDQPPFTSSYSYTNLPSTRAQLTQMTKPTQQPEILRSISYPAARREPDAPHIHSDALAHTRLHPGATLADDISQLHIVEHQREGVEQPSTMINAAREPLPSPTWDKASSTGSGATSPRQTQWVMWVGNVPSNATEEELHAFFNKPPPDRKPGDTTSDGDIVASVFVISHTNCAFINFHSKHALQSAAARFNGRPLRPHDPNCPRLLCRVRTKEDVLKAGVSAQRGTGMHRRWVKDKMRKQHKVFSGPQSTSKRRFDKSRKRGGRPGLNPMQDSDSDSPATTTSTLLATHFPVRYFILKSFSPVRPHLLDHLVLFTDSVERIGLER
jgi:hypothetical protein